MSKTIYSKTPENTLSAKEDTMNHIFQGFLTHHLVGPLLAKVGAPLKKQPLMKKRQKTHFLPEMFQS